MDVYEWLYACGCRCPQKSEVWDFHIALLLGTALLSFNRATSGLNVPQYRHNFLYFDFSVSFSFQLSFYTGSLEYVSVKIFAIRDYAAQKSKNSNYTCVWTVNSIRCIWIKQILSRCMVSWCLWYGSAGMDFTHKSKQTSKQTYKENTRELPRKFMIIFCYFSKYRYAYITP